MDLTTASTLSPDTYGVHGQLVSRQDAGTGILPTTPSSKRTNNDDTAENQSLDREESRSTYGRWEAALQWHAHEEHEPISASGNPCLPFSFGPRIPKQDIINMLPPTKCCDYLLSRYFMYLSTLFPILHGPTFEAQYSTFLQTPSEVTLSWLSLLFVICSLALYTVESNDPGLADLWASRPTIERHDTLALSQQLRSAALICLSQDQFLVHHDLNTLEALLVLLFTICHCEGVERSWALLGMTLNIGVSLRCHTESQEMESIERERRRRCWAGIRVLQTCQAILFRDLDPAFLLNVKSMKRPGSGSSEIQDDIISQYPGQPSHLSLMELKLRIFEIGIQICIHIAGPSSQDQAVLEQFDAAISAEQHEWDTRFLVGGMPSILNTAGYAHWCFLQTHAHQLYLLVHRPFHHSRSNSFRSASRNTCLKSGMALLDIHRKFSEEPRLRCYRWVINGMTSFNALYGAVAIVSCLLDIAPSFHATDYRVAIDTAATRIDMLQDKSPVCAKAYPILRQLQAQLSDHYGESLPAAVLGIASDWIDQVDWFNPESLNDFSWENMFDTVGD